MATSIFFLGRTIATPGSYSQVDATGLEQPGLGAAGIVAVLGEAEGGQPAGTMERPSDFIRLTTPESVRSRFRSGDLREGSAMLFEPSTDPNILGGAALVFAMKVNPATQSTGVLDNASGNAIDLTSEDYGAFTEQINVNLQTASVGLTGFLLTIQFEDIIETVDGLAGDDIATLAYTTSLRTYDTVTIDVLASGAVRANGTSPALSGLDSDALAAWTASDIADITATAADAGKVMTLYGTIAGGALVTEDVTLIDGTVQSTTAWLDLLGALLDDDAAGAITVTDQFPNTRFSFAASDRSKGILDAKAYFVDNTTFDIVSDNAANTQNIYIFGRTSTGAAARETIALNGTTPVTSTISPKQIDTIVLVDLPAADAITLTAQVAQSNPTVQTNLQKTKDFFDALTDVDQDGTTVVGFSWTNITGALNRLVTELDEATGLIAGNHPTTGLSAGIRADMWDVINWINLNSALITADKASGATNEPPLTLAGPVFLSGGVEGTTSVSDYQNALNLLKQTRVNTIVVLTGNSAVHSALEAHCNFMGGIGRNERDGIVGIVKVDGTGVPVSPVTLPTKQEYLDQIVAINSRHIRACGQFIDRFNTEGDRTEFPSYFQACIAAGMQNGSPIGVSLTHKFANVLDVKQDASWSPTDDSEEMIQGGACFMEPVEGVGIRWVRNVTTFLQSDNIAFTEASVNEAVNFAVFTFRTNLEFAVGRRGFAQTLNATKGIALNTLGILNDEGIIVASRGLTLELNVDVLDVSVEIAPVIPINFVKSVIHLVTVQQSV